MLFTFKMGARHGEGSQAEGLATQMGKAVASPPFPCAHTMMSQVTKDKDAAVRGQDFEKAGQLRDREMELKAKIQVRVGVGLNGGSVWCFEQARGMGVTLGALCTHRNINHAYGWGREFGHRLNPSHRTTSLQAIIAGAKEQSKAEAESVESGGPCVTEQDIASIVAQWTGIPIEKVREGGGGVEDQGVVRA